MVQVPHGGQAAFRGDLGEQGRSVQGHDPHRQGCPHGEDQQQDDEAALRGARSHQGPQGRRGSRGGSGGAQGLGPRRVGVPGGSGFGRRELFKGNHVFSRIDRGRVARGGPCRVQAAVTLRPHLHVLLHGSSSAGRRSPPTNRVPKSLVGAWWRPREAEGLRVSRKDSLRVCRAVSLRAFRAVSLRLSRAVSLRVCRAVSRRASRAVSLRFSRAVS
mmetsp:Transcript_2652/g.5940  ORF Transcript_2652/g.5940 Transcript_2652/m.5940 type:complete len:216 (+) Transcript_2652:871-1518(+)